MRMRILTAALITCPILTAAEENLPLTVNDQMIAVTDCLKEGSKDAIEECTRILSDSAPNWNILTETDLITDKTDVYLTRPSSGGQNVKKADPTFQIACKSGELFLSLTGNFKATEVSTLLTFRIDRGEPLTSRWLMNSDGTMLFSRDQHQIYRLLEKSELIVRFITDSDGEITSIFDVSDLSQAARWLEVHCSNYAPPVNLIAP